MLGDGARRRGEAGPAWETESPLAGERLRLDETRAHSAGADGGDGAEHRRNVSRSTGLCNGNEMSFLAVECRQRLLQLGQAIWVESGSAAGDRELLTAQRDV
jgi:hypothetical protein